MPTCSSTKPKLSLRSAATVLKVPASYDLVRWGIAKETMNNYFAAERDNRLYYQSASFETGEEYFAIPTAQYNFSGGKYVQNPGYPGF